MKEIVIKYERHLDFLASKPIVHETAPSHQEVSDFFASLAPQQDDKGDGDGGDRDQVLDHYGFTFHRPEDSDESEAHAGGWRHSSPVTVLFKKVRKHMHRRQNSDGAASAASASFRACIFPALPPPEYSPYTLDPEALISAWKHLLGESVSFAEVEKDPFGNPVPRIERLRRSSVNKEEMNQKFHELHPTVDPSFSLSKLRTLKRILFHLMQRNVRVLDPFIALCAWVYFERLAKTGFVKKKNRRVVLGTSIIISHKFRTYIRDDAGRETLLRLVEILSNVLVDRSTAFKLEYSILCHLSFDIRVELRDIGPHIVHYVSSNPSASFQKACGYTFDALCFIARNNTEAHELIVSISSD